MHISLYFNGLRGFRYHFLHDKALLCIAHPGKSPARIIGGYPQLYKKITHKLNKMRYINY